MIVPRVGSVFEAEFFYEWLALISTLQGTADRPFRQRVSSVGTPSSPPSRPGFAEI